MDLPPILVGTVSVHRLDRTHAPKSRSTVCNNYTDVSQAELSVDLEMCNGLSEVSK